MPRPIAVLLAIHFVLCGQAYLLKAADDPPAAEAAHRTGIPAAVVAALAELPKEQRPVEMRAARNGAVYALLPNGCELIVKEKRNAPVVSVQGWIKSGAIHEQEFLGAGLSHYVEHLLFKGTTKRPQGVLEKEIRAGGGYINAYTSSERTVYHVTTKAGSFAGAFDAVADMIMDSTLPPEEVKKEHGVVTKEIERAIDNADTAIWEAFERCLYQVHPYRVPVLGYADRFKSVGREELWTYYKRRYVPQLTTFICVGDFEAGQALALMAKTVGGWTRTDTSTPVIPKEPPQVAPREVTVRHPLCKVPKMYLGFPNVDLRHPDLFALDVLASVLGDGRASRLYKKVKDEKELVLSVDAWSYTPMYAGVFAVDVTAEEGNLAAARAAVLEVLEEAKQVPPTAEELERAKRKVQAHHVFEQMTAEGVASSLGSDWFVAGDLDFSQTYVEGIGKVRAEEVVAAAKKYLVQDRLNVAVLLPALEKEAGDEAPKEIAHDKPKDEGPPMAERAKALQEKFPQIAKAEAQRLGGGEVFEIAFKSGLRVVVREDRSLPAVHVAIAALGGQRWEPAEKAGIGNLMAELLDRGTRHRSKLEIAETVDALGARLSTFGGRNSFGVNLRCLKDDLSKVFALGAEVFLEPVFPEDEFKKAKTEVLAQIEQQEESLWHLNAKVLRPLLYGAHPYARPVTGEKETVERIAADDLASLHAKWLRPESTAIAFAGDVDVAAAVELAAKHFEALKAQPGFQAPESKIPELDAKKEGESQKAGIEGVMLTVAFRGVPVKDPDRETFDVVAAVLSGLGGRLSDIVREQLGAAYSVGAFNDSNLDGGSFVFYVQTDEENLAKLQEVFFAQAKKLVEEPVGEQELKDIRNYLAGQEAVDLQDQGSVAQRLALAQIYEEGAASVFNRHQLIAKVTAEQIQAAARKYLDLNRCAIAVVRPKAEEGKNGDK